MHGDTMDPVDLARFDCLDCPDNTHLIREYYMVHDAVWANSGVEPHGGMLCIGCLEMRIGRVLTPADFTLAPINSPFLLWNPRSERLYDRLIGIHEVAA